LLFDTVAIVIFIEAHKFNLLLFVVYVELKIRHDDEVIAGIAVIICVCEFIIEIFEF